VQNNSEARHARGSSLRRHRHPGQGRRRLALGDLSLKFLHTPGHVKDLVSILLPGRILTADALLIGSCGRTDLLNGHAVRQYHTLYYTYKSLPDELEGWPGYDYKGRSSSTLGDEKRDNPKMLFGSSVHLDSPPTTKAGVPALDFRVSGLPRKAPKNGFVW
jgi:glyoxylase-like metal-dependent hydrolase (beta-lactamase superfamily II)